MISFKKVIFKKGTETFLELVTSERYAVCL